VRWALGATLAAIAVAVAIGVALVRAPSGEGRSSILVALINGPKVDCLETHLVRADRVTLKPIERPAVRAKGAFEQPVYSPDRKSVALGGNSGTVIVVDAEKMRLTATVRVGPPGDDVRVVAWPARDRLVAVSYTASVPRPYVTRVVAVNPERGDVLASTAFPSADAQHAGATQDGRVPLLIVSRRDLAPPRLVVVGAGARSMWSVPLGGLRAGDAWKAHRTRSPGFAVDMRGERAFVVSPNGSVATVQLGTLKVKYRRVNGLESKRSNALQDRRRSATWLGDGRLGVSGGDSSLENFLGSPQLDANEGRDKSFAPFGLKIVDTRRWEVQTLDRRPSSFEWMRARLIAYGRSAGARRGRQPDQTIIAFDRSGRRSYTVHGNRNTYWQAFDGRLFLFSPRSRLFEVRDARDGRVLGHVAGESLHSLGPC
jgi:hypothetical protein